MDVIKRRETVLILEALITKSNYSAADRQTLDNPINILLDVQSVHRHIIDSKINQHELVPICSRKSNDPLRSV